MNICFNLVLSPRSHLSHLSHLSLLIHKVVA